MSNSSRTDYVWQRFPSRTIHANIQSSEIAFTCVMWCLACLPLLKQKQHVRRVRLRLCFQDIYFFVCVLMYKELLSLLLQRTILDRDWYYCIMWNTVLLAAERGACSNVFLFSVQRNAGPGCMDTKFLRCMAEFSYFATSLRIHGCLNQLQVQEKRSFHRNNRPNKRSRDWTYLRLMHTNTHVLIKQCLVFKWQ